jgi:hypothetical protein
MLTALLSLQHMLFNGVAMAINLHLGSHLKWLFALVKLN